MAEVKIINGIKVTVATDYAEMSRIATSIILERVRKNPNLNILVPAGTTPGGGYEILSNDEPKLFRKVTFFNMDEYCEKKDGEYKVVSEKDSKGYRYYMRKLF